MAEGEPTKRTTWAEMMDLMTAELEVEVEVVLVAKRGWLQELHMGEAGQPESQD